MPCGKLNNADSEQYAERRRKELKQNGIIRKWNSNSFESHGGYFVFCGT